ncbi:MAG TPA: DUF166 family protein [Candidatus Deferrimicrobium sp.]|nr:DUF166 family protein [Candidatus Deferrimicrobium sp.]
MKIGIVTDGKYGDRAYENIKSVFPCEWIQLEEISATVILDDYQLNIPPCDLYISYLRHPDQATALIELGKPTILGISFGPGFLRQVQRTNPKVIAAPTMCSLEPNTNIPEIDEFARHFGRPIFELEVKDNTLHNLKVQRSSPCGSSLVGPKFAEGQTISIPFLQDFAIHVCHECRAPRFGHTCDKEISGIIHIRALITGITQKAEITDKEVLTFINKIGEEYQERTKNK